MKFLSLLTVIFFLSISSILAQPKIQFGVTTEGSFFIPGNYDQYSPPNKNTFGAGIGVFSSRNITGKLSADLGVMYRFKKMKEYYNISPVPDGGYDGYNGYGGYGGYGNYDYGSNYTYENSSDVQGWKTFPLQYVVVPFHLQYLVHKDFFVRGGIETSWLTNYDTGNDQTEWNWTLGFGCQKHKLKWSVNYIRGFKDTFFANELYTVDGMRSATGYRNNMIQLNLSYPIWQKK
jgi:hypothetical protein